MNTRPLDVESRRALARCQRSGMSLAVENPSVLANLKGRGSLGRWAKCYFANRCLTLGEESGVFVGFVYPANTSRTCSKCGHMDKRSRRGKCFVCTACGYASDADINAAKNIAAKGTVSLESMVDSKRSGNVSEPGVFHE